MTKKNPEVFFVKEYTVADVMNKLNDIDEKIVKIEKGTTWAKRISYGALCLSCMVLGFLIQHINK